MMRKIFFMLLCFCATGFAQAQTKNDIYAAPTEKGWSLVMDYMDEIHASSGEWIKETSNHIINFNFKSGKMICREKSTQKLIWTWDMFKQVGEFYKYRLRYSLFSVRTYPFRDYFFTPGVKGADSSSKRFFDVWDDKTYLYINDRMGVLKLVGFKRDNPEVGIVTWQGTPKE